ncbi:unnamed protein product [[Actinomadura] parvosata subsp. kistnae]|uniref:Uncharacterized protein n=1 Tax=[Actinomadura] parvosata subsp. kistnae TaxID=1909395 RepID=A0A1V0A5B8_9ACTN|nr:hypothetical protein [Nonomuraea sp. ATCC 55076]AQZ65416.1 hypothetical protein BKM31_31705 [Nonomuraea sp. ATCC 55076]SPL96748.1 unnamed protein product [Actinomadura parvosata subsp. kistnae]
MGERPGQLGRLTMPTRDQLLREAADKEALAVTFLRYARALPEALEGLPARPSDHETFWRGPAAQRFVTQVIRLRGELDDLEDACLATAESLRRRARRLREQAAQVAGPA